MNRIAEEHLRIADMISRGMQVSYPGVVHVTGLKRYISRSGTITRKLGKCMK